MPFSFLWPQCWAHGYFHEYWWSEGTLQSLGCPHAACLRNDHWYLFGWAQWFEALSSQNPLLFFRRPFQIVNWKLLPGASAHWSWLCLLEPIWQPCSSFRWQSIFDRVHFGLCWIDTPMHLTSSGDVLWDYPSVWFSTRQASPNGLPLLFLCGGRWGFTDPPKIPRKPGKSLIRYENTDGSDSRNQYL